MNTKNKKYLRVLKLREYLQTVSQCSYSYAQINKYYSPLEIQNEKSLNEILEYYESMIGLLKEVIQKYEHEKNTTG